MPISASSPLQTTFPSFMSVFGNDQSADSNTIGVQPASGSSSADRRAYISNYATSVRRDSTSTFESTESSPTTTVSTVASSLTEPSPNSSPESPHSNNKLPAAYPLRGSAQSQAAMDRREQFSSSFPTLPGIERSDSPQKKMRNMKNLSVNTAASNRPATSHLPRLGMSGLNNIQPQQASSAPPTPAFIVPPKAPRRKPSNLGLSITTPESSASSTQDKPAAVPQTPLEPQMKSLRRLQTFSDGPLQSPMAAPEGGMRFPPFNSGVPHSHFAKPGPLSISPVSLSSPIKKQTLEHVKEEPDYEVPLSQEVKSPAYPEGPVCIYDPFVYLYLEPSRIEASEFDVVLNVAREVLNPFKEVRKEPERKMVDKGVQVNFGTADKGVQASFDDIVRDSSTQMVAVEPDTAASEISFRSAFEAQPSGKHISPPTTPKAVAHEPEYIHIPWDHNTNVVEDLLRLCKLIDDRVRQRKKILIHCQCGVSRSASLVVAFGMYRNPHLTVQEAYDAVKTRSRWIGPNMNLIYQLSEFKSKLATNGPASEAWPSWRGNKPEQGGQGIDMAMGTGRKRSLTSTDARSQANRLSTSAPALPIRPLSSAQLKPPLPLGGLSPGPLSAPAHYKATAQAMSNYETDQADSGNLSTISTSFPQLLERRDLPEQIFSPTVEAPQVTPLGAIANDLQNVAFDLSPEHRSDKDTAVTHAAGALASSEPESATSTAPPGSWPRGETESPRLASKSSLSNLKMGFTRLFSKREAAPPLPLRPSAPQFEKQSAFGRTFVDDVPPTPSLLSPRAAEFTASPFHRTSAGDLAGSSTYEQGLLSPQAVDEDPRSPPQRGEAPITRSIFDVI